MSVTAYPTLRLKLTVPQALKLQFLPAIPGSNAAASAADAQAAADAAIAAANTAVAATANKVDKAGDVMTGFLQLNANPVANLQAATKQYVDSHAVAISDGDKGDITVSGGGTVWTVDNNAVTHLDAFTSTLKGVVPASGGGTANFLRADGSWNAPAGGGGGAPVGAEYITSTADATLTAERVLTDTATITWDRTTPGQIKASTAAGGGNVSNSGTPTAGQYGKWLTATTIQGVAPATVLSDIGAQPLDADLTAIAALAGTNTIYYRSAANTWSPVVVSTGLAFSGGNLTATVVSGAPVGAEYITSTADATLTSERVLTDTATVTWDRTTAGQIKATATGGAATLVPPQGRLTLQTGTPVMTTTQAAQTTIFYTPYVGNQIVLYNGTSMVPTTFAELSNLTTASSTGNAGPAAVAANSNYDLFVWSNAGTPTLTRGPAWTNDTTRSVGTALVMVNGIWLNNASITNGPAAQRGTYVGTTRSNASSQLDWIFGGAAVGGVAGFFGVWNCYNRVEVSTTVMETTNTWTCTGTTRAFNGSNNNRVSAIFGSIEDGVTAAAIGSVNSGASNWGSVGVGFNTISALTGTYAATYNNGSNWNSTSGQHMSLPLLGFNFWQMIETSSSAGTGSFGGSVPTIGAASGLTFQARM